MSFKDDILKKCSPGNISFRDIRSVATSRIQRYSSEEKNAIYYSLERGVAILDEEKQLDGYLFSYGRRHHDVIFTAFDCLPKQVFCKPLDIIDWGCGQALATICLLDYAKEHHIRLQIRSITLVEPSKTASARGADILECYGIPSRSIRIVNRLFDDLESSDLRSTDGQNLHLLSNILDVASFDMPRFINTFQQAFQRENMFVCVGPYYANSIRMNEFVVAVKPDTIYASVDEPQSHLDPSWSTQLRVFGVSYAGIERTDDIRRRIEESKKTKQMQAAYVLEAVDAVLMNSEYAGCGKRLLESLAYFNVTSNRPIESKPGVDSKWAVLNNIITRGLPTYASILQEEIFAEKMRISTTDANSPILSYKSTGILNAREIFEALHVIDPRFKPLEEYNCRVLESDFEAHFFTRMAQSPDRYLLQLLEPQRRLSSIVSLPHTAFAKDQRVDFALELPYSKQSDADSPVGFIVELDGQPYHSNIFQKLYDERRDALTGGSNWRTMRLDRVDYDALSAFSKADEADEYLSIMKANHTREIKGKWAYALQCVLTPIAVARLQKIIVEAVLSGHLDPKASFWNITVIERDVPCAHIAIEDLKQIYAHLSALAGDGDALPEINLIIVGSEDFLESPLHGGQLRSIAVETDIQQDICIDISVLLHDKIDSMKIDANASTYYIARSSHYKDSRRTIYTAAPIHYVDFVSKDRTGQYVADEKLSTDLQFFLQTVFRKRDFRQGQLPIISRALSRKPTIGLLPTGGGKSITYQIASLLQPGVTIIVDPLLSLMTDQYRGLLELKIDYVDCINSIKTGEEKAAIINRMADSELLFVFMSPERFMIQNFRYGLLRMVEQNHVYFANGVIDEVHCISEWGHDFRTSYLHLGRNMSEWMRTKNGEVVTLMGLTATASFDVLADVERELVVPGKMELDSDVIVRPEEDSRPELTYRIQKLSPDYSELYTDESYVMRGGLNEWAIKEVSASAKNKAIAQLLDKIPYDLLKINKKAPDPSSPYDTRIPNYNPLTFYSADSSGHYKNAGIIFCPHANGMFGVNSNSKSTSIADSIDDHRIRLSKFVGGDKEEDGMQQFMQNETNLMVATKAFGMGIDKPNVRYTIEVSHPASVEAYVQESGRGGRDRKNAIGYMLFDASEYVFLSVEMLSGMWSLLETNYAWIWNYRERYVLKEDLKDLVLKHDNTEEEAEELVRILESKFESTDKNIQLYFLNNSFKGAEKEKQIMFEFTDGLLNVKPTNLIRVQKYLQDALSDEEVILHLKGNGLKAISSQSKDQFVYINLETLTAYYTYSKGDPAYCSKVGDALLKELRSIADENSEIDEFNLSEWLTEIDRTVRLSEDGIYQSLSNLPDNSETTLSISWENQLAQDPLTYDDSIRSVINDIVSAYNKQYAGSKFQLNDVSSGFSAAKYDDYDDLLAAIDKDTHNENAWWRINGRVGICLKILRIFNKRRTKEDTDKVIYRMCCIGLVEDVTVDYLSETYQIRIRKRPAGGYYEQLRVFLSKYFSPDRVEAKMEEAFRQKGRNEIDRCLGYLTDFIYGNTLKKRLRALDDVRTMCYLGLEKGDDELKEWIHLYFNSKYARDGYTIYNESSHRDEPYSLLNDTEGGESNFEIVRKYIEAVAIDATGTDMENAKHLHGATMLILRGMIEPNGALNLLKVYSLVYQGLRNNPNLIREASEAYITGFHCLYSDEKRNFSQLQQEYQQYNEWLDAAIRTTDESYPFDDKSIVEKMREGVLETILLVDQAEWLERFTKRYTAISNNTDNQ